MDQEKLKAKGRGRENQRGEIRDDSSGKWKEKRGERRS